MSEPDCVFCKIVAGQIPALKVFENDLCLAFLDIGPLAEGHVLVVPKQHYAQISDMPPQAVAAVTSQLPRLVQAVVQATNAEGCNILQNNGPVSGQAVMHVHFHIIPRRQGDGLGYRWNAGKYPEGRAQQVQQALLHALKS